MIHEFREPIRVDTPLGRGYALFVEACAHDYYWTVGMDNGALVTFTQDRLRIARSYTYRRGINDEEMAQIIKEPGDHQLRGSQGNCRQEDVRRKLEAPDAKGQAHSGGRTSGRQMSQMSRRS
jgi:hypothetical protein